MSRKRAYILTIGGFDPSGGAGVLADIKTFEEHKLLGMAVNTANTVQTEDTFQSVNRLSEDLIVAQLDVLISQYKFLYVKVGLIPSIEFIHTIKCKLPDAKIIWDPILKASAGFEMNHSLEELTSVLEKVEIVTPNWEEIIVLSKLNDAIEGAKKLSKYCTVYLKGGHNSESPGRDYIFYKNKSFQLRPKGKSVTPKHGSGCVLSSALAANLAKGYPLHKACLKAKTYVTRVLESNDSLLGFHHR